MCAHVWESCVSANVSLFHTERRYQTSLWGAINIFSEKRLIMILNVAHATKALCQGALRGTYKLVFVCISDLSERCVARAVDFSMHYDRSCRYQIVARKADK